MKRAALFQQLKHLFVALILVLSISIPIIMIAACFDLYCPDSLLLCFHSPYVALLISIAIIGISYWFIFFRANILLELLVKHKKKK